ncbi:hypothetical protein IJG29_00620 [Candidatus Saccharibacteria bacterium]|nr:hypothetical protein [Candidatus Saccharibacteria bacterium]
MKKIQYFLASAASVLTLATAPAAGVFADQAVSQDVTVGDVDSTIYEHQIHWGNLVFDWKYDESTNTYGFKSKIGCGIVADGVEASQVYQENGNLYTDNTCTTLATGELSANGQYYAKTISSGHVTVEDKSTNGRINAKAIFEPASSYSWVTGKIGLQPMGMAYGVPTALLGYNPATDTITYNELSDGNLQSTVSGGRILEGYLYLTVNDTAAARTANIASNDKIGELTIEITPQIND